MSKTTSLIDKMATAQVSIPRRQVIVPSGERLGYLSARESVKEKGGLPSYALHDDTLMDSKSWKLLQSAGYYPAWAREFVVHPEKGGEFKRGQSVVDQFIDGSGREWIFDADCVPEGAMASEKVGLFVNPQEIQISDRRVVMYADPESVVILHPFIQYDNWLGKVDSLTKMPLATSNDGLRSLLDDEKRCLLRIEGAAVRPLARGYGIPGRYFRRYVVADLCPDEALGVGYTAEAREDENAHALAEDPTGLGTLISAAKEELEEISGMIDKGQMQNTEKLLGVLKERSKPPI